MKDLADPEIAVIGTDDIIEGIRRLGIADGDDVLVHCSLSAFGLVAGGEQTVLAALQSAVGTAGTLFMPAQSWQLCDPDFLDDPALPAATRVAVRAALPAFDPVLTPTRTMGRVAELFRCQPGALRSRHPHRSFAGRGPAAAQVLADHAVEDPFGESSPLARLYDLGAKILLLGVGYDSCTALHLAEGRARTDVPLVRNGVAEIGGDGIRRWRTWDEPVVDDSLFPRIGAEFETLAAVPVTRIGSAECRAVPLAPLVDHAVDLLRKAQS
ncbi:MAG: AAC(3) family N-acetyltransferase [Microbacterium sp. 69-10]|uniref:aminoglycoside N(3)-acetyltransferase n=1 Tax=Microbacterium sp. 69-10 TaxID=1895783 RepID=UPI000968438A|nr:AAC(3) family N-acetyltransferase [Microbacterium sp. 69-10]OJU42238.1 MAG: AAC(3) family N-acetyltransferase [Microbacterium sp. 69-10]